MRVVACSGITPPSLAIRVKKYVSLSSLSSAAMVLIWPLLLTENLGA